MDSQRGQSCGWPRGEATRQKTFKSLGQDLSWENPALIAGVMTEFLVKP